MDLFSFHLYLQWKCQCGPLITTKTADINSVDHLTPTYVRMSLPFCWQVAFPIHTQLTHYSRRKP